MSKTLYLVTPKDVENDVDVRTCKRLQSQDEFYQICKNPPEKYQGLDWLACQVVVNNFGKIRTRLVAKLYC